jgi:hypothetical protein
LRRRYARRHWRFLAALIGAGAATSPVLLLIRGARMQAFAFGLWTAMWLGMAAYFVIVLSGSAYLTLGEFGELGTAREVKGLARHGWRIVHHALLGYGDVDTVLIGPGGVVVIETKGGATDWAAPRQQPRLEAAADQAAENARRLRLFLRPAIADAPVHPVVALWPASNLVPTEVKGVTVLPGPALRAWVEGLPDAALTAEQAAAAWRLLSEHVVRRDAYESERPGGP